MTVKEKARLIADILDTLQNSHYLKFVTWESRQRKRGGVVIYNQFDPAPPDFDRGATFFDLVFMEDCDLVTVAKACGIS